MTGAGESAYNFKIKNKRLVLLDINSLSEKCSILTNYTMALGIISINGVDDAARFIVM